MTDKDSLVAILEQLAEGQVFAREKSAVYEAIAIIRRHRSAPSEVVVGNVTKAIKDTLRVGKGNLGIDLREASLAAIAAIQDYGEVADKTGFNCPASRSICVRCEQEVLQDAGELPAMEDASTCKDEVSAEKAVEAGVIPSSTSPANPKEYDECAATHEELQRREIVDNAKLLERIEDSLSYFCDEFPKGTEANNAIWSKPVSYHCGGITPHDLQSILSLLYGRKPGDRRAATSKPSDIQATDNGGSMGWVTSDVGSARSPQLQSVASRTEQLADCRAAFNNWASRNDQYAYTDPVTTEKLWVGWQAAWDALEFQQDIATDEEADDELRPFMHEGGK